MPSIKPKQNRMPEFVVAGLIFASGAWFWSQQLAPRPDPAPEIAATEISDGPQREYVMQPQWLPTGWKTPSASERQAAQKVITAQLNAFKGNKWAQAATYQSKNLKRNFASLQQFRQMMVESYPQFAAYKAVKFGQARFDGTHLQVVATITGQDGKRINAIYMMVKESGKYYVDGVGGGIAPPPAPGMMA